VAFTYVCAQFPGMGDCPGNFTTATEGELWQLVELHGRVAHEEDPALWSNEDRQQIGAIISANSTQ
jgi:hypothetical protein